VIVPPVLESTAPRDGFQTPESFQDTCNRLPRNKKAIYVRLNVLRRLLIRHYSVIEAGCPLSFDPNFSKDDIYDDFLDLKDRLSQCGAGFYPRNLHKVVEGRELEVSSV
jgi:hypothetical protein